MIRMEDLSIKAQEYIKNQREKERKKKQKNDFGSELERRFFLAKILPGLKNGEIKECKTQQRFELLPKKTFCGLSLPAAHYTADFIVKYKDGKTVAIEVKNAKIRKLQRDYIYRRRLFIDNICEPKGWDFAEYIEK